MKSGNRLSEITFEQKVAGWLIHIFTTTGAYVGVLALYATYLQCYVKALVLMGVSTMIDALDGWFARRVEIKLAVPQIDGALLDNIVDYLNYTIVPTFFLIVVPLVPLSWCFFCVLVIVISSAYQFTQADAKTPDHFFKGFPSYWNIVVFYLYLWGMSQTINMLIVLFLGILSFVPIKFIHLMRLEYVTDSKFLQGLMFLQAWVWGAATLGLLWTYPLPNYFLVSVSISCAVIYVLASLYRTWFPLVPEN